jgi:hypothetical protein
LPETPDEDAAVVQEALRQHVVAGDDHVAAGHHQHDRHEPRDRQRVAAEPSPAGSTVARRIRRVEELGHAVGVDDRHEPVDEDAEVDDEDRVEHGRVNEEAEQGDPVDADDGPGRERQGEDRPGREGQRAHGRASIQLTQAGEDQGEEGSRERRPRARSRPLWFLHRG